MIELQTNPVAVTVYPDRARVSRCGKARLDPGEQRLQISGLPLAMNPDSARVAAQGSAHARLLGLQVRRVFFTETPAEQARMLEEQIETQEEASRALQARIALVKSQRARLDELGGHSELYATALAAGEMQVSDQLALFKEIGAQIAELDAELLKLEAEGRLIARRLEKLRKELEQLRAARPRERYQAIVELEVLEAGELEVELTYMVSNASWKPLYDLRLEDQEDAAPSLEIGYLAQVSQNTAEDWPELALTLSTARPALAAILPELRPWYIRPAVPAPRRKVLPAAQARSVMSMAVADEGAPAVAEAAEAQPVQAEMVSAQVETAGAALAYHIPVTVTIPADGAPHKVSITRFSLPPQLDYISAPKLVDAAYRRATLVNDSAYTLLPGSANLFAGDEFIGASKLELVAPQGEIELFFGADDRVKVERELKRREVDKRFIGGKRRIRFGYEVRVENLLPYSIEFSLHDQLPVSRHEEIKVKLESASPEPDEHSELGLLEWKLGLGSKDEVIVRFDFSVEHPQEMQVAGLL